MLKDNGLTLKQIEFCKAFVCKDSETFSNATKSYIKAGYSVTKGIEQNACRLLSQDKIRAEIKRLRDEEGQREQFNLEWLDQKLRKFLDRCELNGDRTNEKGALQLIGQRLAAFADKHINENTTPDEISTCDREALKDIAAEYTRKKSIKLVKEG